MAGPQEYASSVADLERVNARLRDRLQQEGVASRRLAGGTILSVTELLQEDPEEFLAASVNTALRSPSALPSNAQFLEEKINLVAGETQGDAPAIEGEEKLCRYCFAGEEKGVLVSPCRCSGGQKYVHAACLRKWACSVISSSTASDEVRHKTCSVCKADFIPPILTDSQLSTLRSQPCVEVVVTQYGSVEARTVDPPMRRTWSAPAISASAE